MASADFFDLRITGCGAHGAMPERSKDAVIIATTLAQAIQTIVSRNVEPLQAAVISITQITPVPPTTSSPAKPISAAPSAPPRMKSAP